MRLILILFFAFTAPLVCMGQANYAVSSVPEQLLKDANVIKRMEDIRFEINNTGEAILKKKYALTIMNEKGDRHAAFLE